MTRVRGPWSRRVTGRDVMRLAGAVTLVHSSAGRCLLVCGFFSYEMQSDRRGSGWVGGVWRERTRVGNRALAGRGGDRAGKGDEDGEEGRDRERNREGG